MASAAEKKKKRKVLSESLAAKKKYECNPNLFFSTESRYKRNFGHDAILEAWTGSERSEPRLLLLPAVLLTAKVNISSYQSPVAQPAQEKTTFYEIFGGMAVARARG